MTSPPPKLPVRGHFKSLYQWLNDLRDYTESTRPISNANAAVDHKRIGTAIRPQGGGTTTTDDTTPRWG
jgi:hypothetical protein